MFKKDLNSFSLDFEKSYEQIDLTSDLKISKNLFSSFMKLSGIDEKKYSYFKVDSLSRPLNRFFSKESQYFLAKWLLAIFFSVYISPNIGRLFIRLISKINPIKKMKLEQILLIVFWI